MKSLGTVLLLLGLVFSASCFAYVSPGGMEQLVRSQEQEHRNLKREAEYKISAYKERSGDNSVSTEEIFLEQKLNRAIDESKAEGDKLQEKREGIFRTLAISGVVSIVTGLILISTAKKSK